MKWKKWEIMAEFVWKTLKNLNNNLFIIPLVPALAVLVDYTLTFLFADSRTMILQWESSPLLKFATMNDMVVIYLAGIMLFYYFMAYIVLRLLYGSPVYRIAAGLIFIISITHVLGGMSWYFRSGLYSNIIYGVSLTSIIIAIVLFSYVTIRHPSSSKCTSWLCSTRRIKNINHYI